MSDLTWEQKLEALNALTRTEVKMRSPGNWYVSAYSREIADKRLLTGTYGNGDSPQAAVENDWRLMTTLPPTKRIVIQAMTSERAAFRWNGFMWQRVGEP